MNFFDRYAQLCREQGIDPCSQKAETLIGINKTTANKWNVNGTTPKGDTVRLLADYFHVSADYLLGRTEDRRDYAKQEAHLSADEEKLLKLFAVLEDVEKKELLSYAEFKAGR